MAADFGQPRVTVHRTADELEALRPYWNRSNTHRNADLDFYLFLSAAQPEFVRPHVLVAYDGELPNAMLIGRLENRRMNMGLKHLTSRMPLVSTLTFIEGGLIGEISSIVGGLFIRSILDSLRDGEAHLAYLECVKTDSQLYACMNALPGFLSKDYFPGFEVRFARRVECGKGSFLKSLSKKQRYYLRRRAQLVSEDFGEEPTICHFHDETDIERLMMDAEAIAQTSYQRGLGVGYFHSEALRQHLHIQAKNGFLRAYILYIGGQPSAFWFASLYKDTLYSDMLAVNPRYGKYYPGIYLLLKAVEDVSDVAGPGHTLLLDFGHRPQEYKMQYNNTEWREASAYIFAPTLIGLFLNILRSPLFVFTRAIRDVTRNSSVINRIRRRIGYGKLQKQHTTTSQDG
jgi:hypothetical protein